MTLGTLKQRSEFLYVREGAYAARGAVVVQCRPNAQHIDMRYGVTATKRIGNAVIRNRAKRRLRDVARQLLPELGVPGHDYVLIARDRTVDRPWERLLSDTRKALQFLSSPGQSAPKS
jgi:ribonuclease P protein component